MDGYAPINSPHFNEFFRDVYLRDTQLYVKQFQNAICGGPFVKKTQQEFVAKYINDNTPYRGLLLWHGLGSGKTCSSINIANNVKTMSKTIMVGASLVNNFKGDYPKCGILNADQLKYYINNKEEKKIPPLRDPSYKFNIVTSNGVLNKFSSDQCQTFEDSLIIIDESQILVSTIVSSIQDVNDAERKLSNATLRKKPYYERAKKEALNNSFYQLYLCLRKLENAKIVCLSGTPIVKTPFELAVLFNIIHGDINAWQANVPIKPLDENINKHIFMINDAKYIYKCPSKFINTSGRSGYVSKSPDAISNDAFEALLKTYYTEVTRFTRPLFTESANDFNKLSLDVIQSRIIGLTSYFSNIESLFPTIKLPGGDSIGYSNDHMPLFYIKNLSFSDYQTRLQAKISEIEEIYGRIIINGIPTKTENIVFSSIKSIRLNSIQQFAYPGLLEYLEKFTPAMLQSEDFQFVIAVDKRKAEESEDSEDKRARVEIAGPLGERFAVNTLKTLNRSEEDLAAASGLLHLKIDRSSLFSGGGYVRNYTNLYKHPVYKELSDYKSAIWIPGQIPEGQIPDPLKLPQLREYSPKMASIIETILANLDKLHIVYSEFLKDNIPFIRALQHNGGFTQFSELTLPLTHGNRYVLFTGCSSGTSEPEEKYATGQYNPELLVGNEGKCWSDEVRKTQLEVFKQNENKEGTYIQVIIINSAAAEGISMKNIRYVHFLSKPPTMSKLFQIIGRGRRDCSHKELPIEERDITPILYLMPDEIKKYDEMVATNNTFLPYLNMLKQASIDCAFSKNEFVDRSIATCASDVPSGGKKQKYTKKYIKKRQTTRKYKKRAYEKRAYKKSRKYKKIKKQSNKNKY
jgi:hypothetical protein